MTPSQIAELEAYWRRTNTGWARAISYEEYLKSRHWRAVRKAALVRAGRKCQLCGKNHRRLDVHHNCYDRLGAELDTDVVVLCDYCHTHFHGRVA